MSSDNEDGFREIVAVAAMVVLMLDKKLTDGAEPEDIADMAYEQADAMLVARAKRVNQ